jgi:multiple sugar transport system substrate-binding protein
MKRTLVLFTSLLVLVSLILTGCSSSQTSNVKAGSNGNITITYGYWDDGATPTLKKDADAFHKLHPNITVKFQLTPWAQYWTKMDAAATGGSLPDLMWMNGPNVEKYAESGILLDISNDIKKDNFNMGNFDKQITDLYTYGGKNYGMPLNVDVIGLWYNKKIFDDARIPYPDSSWDVNKFKAVAKELTNKSKGIYGTAADMANQQNYYDTIYQFGGNVISTDKKKSGFDNPKTIQGLQFWTDLINEGVSPSAATLQETPGIDLFNSGKVAMIWGGSWFGPLITNKDVKNNISTAVLPKGPEKSATILHGIGTTISAKTQNPEAAWEFLNYLGSKEAATTLAKSDWEIPAYKGMQDIVVKSYPSSWNYQSFFNELSYGVAYPISKETTKWQAVETKYLAQAWAGKISMKKAAETIASEMNKILANE